MNQSKSIKAKNFLLASLKNMSLDSTVEKTCRKNWISHKKIKDINFFLL